MRVISHLSATTNFQIAWEEIRPLAGRPFMFTLEAIKERYQFQNAEQSATGSAQGLVTPHLQVGAFHGDAQIPFNSLDFHSLGIFVGAATTEQTFRIADDLFVFLQSLGFREPPADRPRYYSTIIVVDVGAALANIFKRWEKISAFANSVLPSHAQLQAIGVKFLPFIGENAMAEGQFVFEKRVPAPKGQNWMYSQAPLSTEDHLKLLEMIEQEFAK
jgi:hypothetical protein